MRDEEMGRRLEAESGVTSAGDELVVRLHSMLRARKIEYSEQKRDLFDRAVIGLYELEAAGEREIDAQGLSKVFGLGGKRLAAYVRNLELLGLVQGIDASRDGVLPFSRYALSVRDSLDGCGEAASGSAEGRSAALSRAEVGEEEIEANGYLRSNPKKRREHGRELAALATWLGENPEPPVVPVHVNERSYEIFGDEKLLSDERVQRLVRGVGLDEERLGICANRSAFLFTVAPGARRRITVLLVENQAPYDAVAHALYLNRGPLDVYGTRVDAVLHSNGHAAENIAKVESYIESFGYSDYEMVYWGDIDRSGVRTFLLASEGATRPFRPLVALYEECAKRQWARVRGGYAIEAASDEDVACDVEAFVSLFEDGAVLDMMRIVLQNALRVPQEIMTRADFDAMVPRRRGLPGKAALGAVAHAAGFAGGLCSGAARLLRGRRADD